MDEEIYNDPVARPVFEFFDAIQAELEIYFRTVHPGIANTPFGRRAMVRTLFGALEAMTSMLKTAALLLTRNNLHFFSPGELNVLKEKKSFRRLAPGTKDLNALLAVDVLNTFWPYGRAMGKNYTVDFQAEGQPFLEGIAVRNRVIHPKGSECWDLSEHDELKAKNAWRWFLAHFNGVSDPS